MTARFRNGVQTCKVMDWIRRNPSLDSRDIGISVTDIDAVVHRYLRPSEMSNRDRSLQELMFVEIKTFGAAVPFAQRDTFSKVNAAIRSMVGNPIGGITGCPASSCIMPDGTELHFWGIHCLRMSAACPETSDWIGWDKHQITVQQLESLLAFDLNPYTLRPRDPKRRRHKRSKKERQQSMFQIIKP